MSDSVAKGAMAVLALADGSVFYGTGIGADGSTVGEVVFNTSMTGYQEILTDPSYAGQLVTLTYPHIGNTGCNGEDTESGRIQKVWAEGLIIRDLPLFHSSFRADQSLDDYLKQHNIVAIADIDTRRLTRILRTKGAQNGCIMTFDEADKQQAVAQAIGNAQNFAGLDGQDLAKTACDPDGFAWREGVWTLDGVKQGEDTYHVVAYDFGTKTNILRMLAERGCRLTVVPATTPASAVLDMNPDGVFLSNGPGDPAACGYAIDAVQELLAHGVPLFGICLGHQLLALASGAKTVKMKFGHHGANHPVQELATGTVMITSQNHGFAVDETTLPDTLKVTHRSLFDGSNQGIERTDTPAFSFQGHPEASPGPHDCGELFDKFILTMKKQKADVTKG